MVTHNTYERIARAILIVGSFAISGCTSSTAFAATESKVQNDFYGDYQVMSAERYRGGLTSEEEARALIKNRAIIADNKFSYREKDISNPIYNVECVLAYLGEGNVDSRGLSNFYGFLTDREEICLLQVSDGSGKFVWEFEIINSETLWDLYDGWIFELTKAQ